MLNRAMSGDLHNHCLNASRDGSEAIKTLPGLMLAMLREDGWKEMARPIDGKVFTHACVDDWVLGEPWGGLNFASWDMLYAILERSDKGREARKLLIERGAPADGFAEDLRKEKAAGKSLRQIAREKGVGKSTVQRELLSHHGTGSKSVWLAADPARAAEAVIKARGSDYARTLATAILATVATGATAP
jgi:hypothetical protein